MQPNPFGFYKDPLNESKEFEVTDSKNEDWGFLVLYNNSESKKLIKGLTNFPSFWK
jgi:hypothetical protein